MQGCRVPASCPATLYTALAHTSQDSVLLTYRAPQTPWVQSCPLNAHDQRADAIENA
jgi:hypothetical protein